jgi:hypothetical protein
VPVFHRKSKLQWKKSRVFGYLTPEDEGRISKLRASDMEFAAKPPTKPFLAV